MTEPNSFEKKIAIIKDVASTITSTDNLDSICNLVLDLALGYTRAKTGSILLLEGKDSLTIKAARGIDPELVPGLKIKLGEDICGRVAKEKIPLLVKDIKSDSRIRELRLGKYETDSFISCPILMRERLLGVINITDKADGSPFSEDEADLISILATQTAIALEHARLMAELRFKALELDDRNRALIDADRLKTEFVVRMSHELRTPLNSITGAVYYLREKSGSKADREEFVQIISDETGKLIHLLDGLLNFTHLDKEELVLRKKILSVRDVVDEVMASKFTRDLLAKKRISTELSFPETLPSIVGEKVRLLQSLMHLLEGLIHYTQQDDVMEIGAHDRESAIELELLLRNRQIPEGEIPLMFDERSLWSDMASARNRMKIYLAKRTIEIHGGAIDISNTEQGLRVTMSFPKSTREYRNAQIDELAELMLSFTAEAMHLDRCSIMLSDDLTGELTIRSARGVEDDVIKSTRLKVGDRIAGWVAYENRPLLVEDIERDRQLGKKSLPEYTTKSLLSLPITIEDKVVGVLNLNNKTTGETFEQRDLSLAQMITQRISRVIGRVRKGDISETEFSMLYRGLQDLVNAERQYQKKGSIAGDLVMKIMEKMQKSEEDTQLALYLSVLYDLGLTQIDESILAKTRQLTAAERKIIRTHPLPGVRLIDYIETDDAVKKIILHHHECYDGSGYPDGLKGDEIPFLSRLLAVVDTYTAMIEDRPYRKALSSGEAVEQIKAAAGSVFDPDVVAAFSSVL